MFIVYFEKSDHSVEYVGSHWNVEPQNKDLSAVLSALTSIVGNGQYMFSNNAVEHYVAKSLGIDTPLQFEKYDQSVIY